MKRLFCWLLPVLLLVSLVGCGFLDEVDEPYEGLTIVTKGADAEQQSAPAALPPETTVSSEESTQAPPDTDPAPAVAEDGVYDSKEEVALYVHLYGHLPANYITKQEAEALGWPGGELERYAPGKCIGGSRFGNYEGLLPDAPGRTWTECDIDTLGAKSRGAKRLVFSNDGLIYYTEDHYESFELLYGEGD